MTALVRIALVAALLAAAAAVPCGADQGAAKAGVAGDAQAVGQSDIPYKPEPRSFGGYVARAIVVFLFASALVVGVVYAMRRYFPAFRAGPQSGRARIVVREYRRVSPKLSLLVVEFDGKSLLVGQAGDSLVVLDRSSATVDGAAEKTNES